MAINQLLIHLSFSFLHFSTYYELIEHEQSFSIPNLYGNDERENSTHSKLYFCHDSFSKMIGFIFRINFHCGVRRNASVRCVLFARFLKKKLQYYSAYFSCLSLFFLMFFFPSQQNTNNNDDVFREINE